MVSGNGTIKLVGLFKFMSSVLTPAQTNVGICKRTHGGWASQASEIKVNTASRLISVLAKARDGC